MSDPFDLADDLTPPPPAVPPPPDPAAVLKLDTLNESQRAAVDAVEGPVLVLAGAGTGKTRVLTTRLANILVRRLARPYEVLAVTFTNKAANEMKERVARLVSHDVEGWWVGTFHAIGARILRRNAEGVGLRSDFTILDADDQVRLLKQLAESHPLDAKKWPPRVLSGVIQRWKDRGLTPAQVTDAEGADTADGHAVALYHDYQERLKAVNAADFGDLLLHCLTLFQTDTMVRERYQRQFRYILVDEYQDTNVAQYLWLRLLAQGHRNICCVGDDDQSIYSWRGAEVGNILRFETDFPGARVVRLERNYRSTPHILGAASGLIAHNEDRLGKTLFTGLQTGEKVRVRGLWDGEQEAQFVGDEIETLHRRGHPLDDMAILVRAGFQTREFEERLVTLGIPYRVLGGPRFYERREIRDAIAYLRVVVQPDDDLAFERIVNLPKRGLGPATLQIAHTLARRERLSLTRAIARLVETDEFKPKARATLRALLDDFARWRSLVGIVDHAELTRQILDESGYTAMWQEDKTPEAPGRLENLKELASGLKEFDSLADFLEHVSLVMENDETTSGEKVNLMTLHGAKGLEFRTVFLPGWEEGLFPHQRALDEGGTRALEEERRLAYVGLTRAREHAIVSFATRRRLYHSWQACLPSRFIDELPPDHVEADMERGIGRGLAEQPSAFVFDDWGRGRGRPWQKARPVEADSWRAESRPAPTGFEPGQRVFHQKFGYGQITLVDGDKLEIDFDKAGAKKVVASFVAAA